MEMLTVRARIMGLTPEELDVLIKTSGQKTEDNIDNVSEKLFAPKVFHVVLAVALAILIAIVVFLWLIVCENSDSENAAYFGLENQPVTEMDLRHLYSGTYDGKSVLITVKDVTNDNGRCVMVFDLKCDFVPVAQNCKCYVDFDKKTFEFEDSVVIAKKLPLGSGSISRSATGKVVFRSSSNLYELLQL